MKASDRFVRSLEAEVVLEDAFEEEGPSPLVIPIDYRESERMTQRLGEIGCRI